ncbi:protein GVQW3-like [Octopus bimaculoides]|uniref:protein GVQW3-like n=1 Tax=Octopus bimaculoides TaxID=37653 RepID=UPI00071D1B4D|nr:protein GVQW3-like [Octopus bimaculoides]|eukprot:XP_014770698.1 PREDICTED: putative uncharacterized protein FLJ37770 [Octopus bimaculoides]
MRRQAYSDGTTGRTQYIEWHGRFKTGKTSLKDVERSETPATNATPGNVKKCHKFMHEDHRRAINDIVDVVALSYGSVQAILMSELNMRQVSAKFLLRLLTTEQKDHRVEIYQDLRQRSGDDPPFIPRIITADERWVYGCEPET